MESVLSGTVCGMSPDNLFSLPWDVISLVTNSPLWTERGNSTHCSLAAGLWLQGSISCCGQEAVAGVSWGDSKRVSLLDSQFSPSMIPLQESLIAQPWSCQPGVCPHGAVPVHAAASSTFVVLKSERTQSPFGYCRQQGSYWARHNQTIRRCEHQNIRWH